MEKKREKIQRHFYITPLGMDMCRHLCDFMLGGRLRRRGWRGGGRKVVWTGDGTQRGPKFLAFSGVENRRERGRGEHTDCRHDLGRCPETGAAKPGWIRGIKNCHCWNSLLNFQNLFPINFQSKKYLAFPFSTKSKGFEDLRYRNLEAYSVQFQNNPKRILFVA